MEDDHPQKVSTELFYLSGELEARERLLAEDLKALEGREMIERLKTLATWDVLCTLILARDRPGELLPDSHGQANGLNRLTGRWMSTWRLHSRRLREAAKLVATAEGISVEEIKWRALQLGIFLALHDAEKPQVTRIGRDRAWGTGSEIVLLQKRDLKQLAREGLTEELVKKLTKAPVGLRVFWPGRLVRPIEGAFLSLVGEVDPEAVRPVDLRWPYLKQWARCRAIQEAERWLLDVAEDFSSRDLLYGAQELTESVAASQDSALDTLIAAEDVTGFEDVLEIATPRQREILELLSQELANGLSLARAKEAVAAELGISVNALDVAFSRLRERAKEKL